MYQRKIIIYGIDDIHVYTPPTNHIVEAVDKKETNDILYNTLGLRITKPERGNIYKEPPKMPDSINFVLDRSI